MIPLQCPASGVGWGWIGRPENKQGPGGDFSTHHQSSRAIETLTNSEKGGFSPRRIDDGLRGLRGRGRRFLRRITFVTDVLVSIERKLGCGEFQSWQIPGGGLLGLGGCDIPPALVPRLAIRARQLLCPGARLGLPKAMGDLPHVEKRCSEPREHRGAHLLEACSPVRISRDLKVHSSLAGADTSCGFERKV